MKTTNVQELSLHDCMELWNEKATDHYCRFVEMREMEDLAWWNTLSNEMGAWDLVNVVLNSADTFNNSDKFFFWDAENDRMVSFSTKQELIEQIGEGWFVETLNEE